MNSGPGGLPPVNPGQNQGGQTGFGNFAGGPIRPQGQNRQGGFGRGGW